VRKESVRARQSDEEKNIIKTAQGINKEKAGLS
jgi:hypothetical protein